MGCSPFSFYTAPLFGVWLETTTAPELVAGPVTLVTIGFATPPTFGELVIRVRIAARVGFVVINRSH